MKKMKSISSSNFDSDDYANALFSLRNLIPQKNDQNSQNSVLEQEKKLSCIFLKTKKQKMQDIFIEKLKRVLSTNPPCEVKHKQPPKGPCGFLVRAIEFPEHFQHFAIFLNLVVLVILIFLATLEGFVDGFGSQQAISPPVLALKIFCLMMNTIYFLLKMSNKSFGAGQNLTYIHQVIKAYALSGRLFLDFITIVLQIFNIVYPQMALSGFFFFFLIIVLAVTLPDLTPIEAAYLKSEKAVLVWGLIKVCLSNIMFAHFMAGFILAMSRIDLEKNWMTRAGIDQQTWLIKYVYAFYWGTTIMMTVGFGDMLPGNPSEVIITSFLEMVSCIILGFNISRIGHIVSSLAQKSETLNKKLTIFDRMTQTKGSQKYNISHQLQQSIYTYLKQTNSGSNNLEFQQSKQLLSELPQHLRKSYYQQANQYIFSSVLFFNRLKPTTVQKLALKLDNKFYYAGAYLLGSQQRMMVLQQGEIGFAYNRRGSALNSEIFDSTIAFKGKNNLLLNPQFLSLYQEKNYLMVAKSHSIIWQAKIQDIIQCLKQSAIDFQYYFSILHKHKLDEDQWCAIQCVRCSQEGRKKCHVIFECPRIVYRPFKYLIIQKSVSVADKRTCQRKRARRQRNQYSKISALAQKKTFSKLIQKLDIVKKSYMPIFQGNVTLNNSVAEVDLQTLPNFLKQQNLTIQQIFETFEKAIRKYDTGYQQGFWELEIDQAYNYQFYFANQNANRLSGIYVQNINKNYFRLNKQTYSPPLIQQQMSIVIG